MIDGLIITPLKQIFDERGKVMHMMRKDTAPFKNFGEIYFSTANPGVVKAWHKHQKMTLNYTVLYGEIKFVLYDDRVNSKTKGKFYEIFISPENYLLVTVPPLIWNGFKCIGTSASIVANCADIPHNSDEIIRKKPTDKSIPYDWEIKLR